LLYPHATSFAYSNIPSLALVGGILDDPEVGAATDDVFRLLRCRPRPAMLMKIKRMISLDISVAESEIKPDARACHPLVGGVAMSALMKLILAPISSSNLRNLAKLSGHLAVKKALTKKISVHTIINSSHNRPSSYSHTA